MKNRTTIVLIIILIITIMIGLTIVSMKKNDKNQIEPKTSQNENYQVSAITNTNNQTNQENNLTVKMRYNTLKYDVETYDYIKKEISLTKEQQNKIINFYKNTDLSDLSPDEQVDLGIIGIITLEFSDGNSIAMDDNRDEYALLNNKKTIKISAELKQYILNIIND